MRDCGAASFSLIYDFEGCEIVADEYLLTKQSAQPACYAISFAAKSPHVFSRLGEGSCSWSLGVCLVERGMNPLRRKELLCPSE